MSIIVSRILTLQNGASERPVPINIAAPVQGDGYWECQLEIGWPEGIKQSRSRGYDGVQALYIAMQTIAVHLYASPHHTAGNLR